MWCSGQLFPFKAQPACWKGQSEKEKTWVLWKPCSAMVKHPCVSMLFWPPVQTAEPYSLLWRKLTRSQTKPVKWVTPKFPNWYWSDLLVDLILNCIFKMFSLTTLNEKQIILKLIVSNSCYR